ncbi:hypothetical protein A9264_11685 [Vibrio sp. UCD-FRSSP16_10]|nr:hypothetical protein A9260_11895 [Vibrio sp. UCD-FRSSP16_30]OBT21159.1 hypothetical protein A9264_11685 [Vibrio sp. UCD-FRSSP16_10]
MSLSLHKMFGHWAIPISRIRMKGPERNFNHQLKTESVIELQSKQPSTWVYRLAKFIAVKAISK